MTSQRRIARIRRSYPALPPRRARRPSTYQPAAGGEELRHAFAEVTPTTGDASAWVVDRLTYLNPGIALRAIEKTARYCGHQGDATYRPAW